MDTKAGTIGVSTRPAGFTVWTVAVSALAAAALIMSAVAITMAAGDRAATGVASGGINTAPSTGVALWDAAKLEAAKVALEAAIEASPSFAYALAAPNVANAVAPSSLATVLAAPNAALPRPQTA